MDKYLEKYIEELNLENRSKNTMEAYIRDINKFLRFIEEKKETLDKVELVTIMEYSQCLQLEGRAVSSIVRNIVAVRNFYKYLNREGILSRNPLINYNLPKFQREIPEILSIKEVDLLLSSPDEKSIKGIRDKAMLELMYSSGLKVSELLNLSLEDLDLNLGYIKCKGTKDKERIVPIGSKAHEALKKYIEIREEFNIFNLECLFLNKNGYKMTRQGFWKIVKGYAKMVKINKKINLYTLRHSFAVHLLENGADIKAVQELLGHCYLSATQFYAVNSKKSKLLEVYKKAHPRA